MIIVEDATETLAPAHRLRVRDNRSGPQKPVFEALVITFTMIVRHEMANRMLE